MLRRIAATYRTGSHQPPLAEGDGLQRRTGVNFRIDLIPPSRHSRHAPTRQMDYANGSSIRISGACFFSRLPAAWIPKVGSTLGSRVLNLRIKISCQREREREGEDGTIHARREKDERRAGAARFPSRFYSSSIKANRGARASRLFSYTGASSASSGGMMKLSDVAAMI